MKKTYIKNIALASCLLVFSSFSLTAHANGCKVKVKYSNAPWSGRIVGSERVVIHAGSTSTTLRKHMRAIINIGGHDVSIKFWDITGFHWKTIRKDRRVNVRGDLKKVQCLSTPRHKKPSKHKKPLRHKKHLIFKGAGLWRNKSSSRPKGVYDRIETTLKACKRRCLIQPTCKGIEYTIVYRNRNKNICEIHTDRYHHIIPNYNPKAYARVWLKR